MTDFGVQPTGFVRKTLQDILAEIEADQLAEISPLWDVSSDQPNGQNNGIFSRQISIVWELAEVIYNSFNPDAAEDDALENVSKISGTERRGASYTTVIIECDLEAGTTLESGNHFVSQDGNPDLRFTPESDFTASVDGVAEILFRSENLGPFFAPAGTLTVRATPVTGWNDATNPDYASTGRDVDTDQQLRDRREAQLTASGASTVDAIRADLLELDDVESVTMFENVTDTTDANGLPPHSFEAVIFDGDIPAADDNEIAQKIWNSKPSGIRSFGDQLGDAIDSQGNTHSVAFSRVTLRDVWLEYDLVTDGTYAGDAAVKTFVAELANAGFRTVGKDVLRVLLEGQPMLVTGVTNVISLKLGFSASPTQSNDLSIGVREIARFDTTRITIV